MGTVENRRLAIAHVCHVANRAWCIENGDHSQPSWEDAPKWQKDSALTGVALHLDDPGAGDAASHESWMQQKIANGWVYGAEKDPVAKTHPCLVPFAELPAFQQAKDRLFRYVVHAMRDFE